MAVPDLRSNSHYMNKLPTSTQASGRSNFEELGWPCAPPTVVGEQSFADPQRSLYYRQPYSAAMNSLNPAIPLFPNHPAIHEPILPKFPPQMFEIPDIQDSNSVFNEGSFQANAGVARPVPLHHASFDPSAAAPPSVCRTLLPFPGEWRPPSYISLAGGGGGGGGGGDGSTNSSPPVHNEENNGYDVPLSQPLTQQQNVYSSSTAKAPIKKAKSPKKRKRKDPNEPQKPVSAYSLFFRNAQSAIKTRNPNATFGDISKIVASMWDNLDNEIKRFYKRQMEVAKKEYLKQLAVYRANLSTQESEGRSASSKEESEPSQQQAALTKVSSSSSSSSLSSSLLASHGDESTSQQGPSASEVQTQDHSSAVLHQRPPSVEASVHRLPISHQAMAQHQPPPPPPPPPVYFKELVPGGLSPLRNGGVYGVPAMPQNMFQSYETKRSDYFGPGIGISQSHYVDNRYAAAGMWNHSLQNDSYTPKCHNWTLWPK